jgi:hypothetical protein
MFFAWGRAGQLCGLSTGNVTSIQGYFSRYKGIIYFVAKNSLRFRVAINSRFHSCPIPLSFLYIFNIVQLVFVLA